MITTEPSALPYGLPEAEELEALANAYFPELGPSGLGEAESASYAGASIPGEPISPVELPYAQDGGGAGSYIPDGGSVVTGGVPQDSAYIPEGCSVGQGNSTKNETGGFPEVVSITEPWQENLPQTGAAPEKYAPQVFSRSQAAEAQKTIDVPTSVGGDRVTHREQATTNTRNESIIIGSRSLQQIRDDFPILSEKINGNPLVWLDNGATTQRPRAVIDRLTYYFEHENSNVHRGAHELAARSTDAYENARQTVADFIGAPGKDDIIFVRGTTEGINLVAHSYVKQYLEPGDEIIVSILEHHANIVPWQLIAQETGAVLRVIPCDESGQLILSEYEKLFNRNTKFVSVTQVSNVLGTVTPVEELIAIAHRHGVRILIDGAQSVAHIPVDVTAMDADFFVFSGHKIYAPTGIGVVYGKKELLEAARPYHGGGNMILDVTFERTIYNPAPNKFEAGTGSISDAVGLGTALEYLNAIGMPEVGRWEHELLNYALAQMKKVKGLHLVGTAREKASALAFKLDGYSDEEVGQRLNQYGIAVRTGHHCAQPVLRRFGLESTVRPTLALYNSPDDVDALVKVLRTFA